MSLCSLTHSDELKAAFQLLKDEFSEGATEADFLVVVEKMFEEGCYMFGWQSAQEIVSVACVAVRTDFANGTHLAVYEIATDANRRSQGFGQQLMNAVQAWAKKQGCRKVIL